jgi:hypothetical protein
MTVSTDSDLSRSNSLTDLAARAKAEHAAVAGALKTSLSHALAAGDILIEAKAQLKHGQWLPWLKSCGISERTAQRYIRLARNRAIIESKSDTVSDLGIRGALALISLPRFGFDSELADSATNTVFISEWLRLEEEHSGSQRSVRRQLCAEAELALDRLRDLCESQPQLVEIANDIWNEELNDRFVAANAACKAAQAADMGMTEEELEEIAGESDLVTAYNNWSESKPWLSQETSCESGLATEAVLKIRDVCAEWVPRVEARAASIRTGIGQQ